MTTTTIAMSLPTIIAAAQRAARAIPPLWPLASSVAVNPWPGQRAAGSSGGATAARVRYRRHHAAVLVCRAATVRRDHRRRSAGSLPDRTSRAAPAERVRAQARHQSRTPCAAGDPDGGRIGPRRHGDRLARHRQRAHRSLGRRLLRSRPGTVGCRPIRRCLQHMADHRDPRSDTRNRRPRRFSQSVSDAPATAEDALVDCVARLGLSPDALDGYFHRLLTTLGGWGQVARYRLWQAELNGGTDACVTDLLAIRMLWEAALLHNGGSALVPGWQSAIAAYAAPVAASSDDVVDSILQEAAERAAQRNSTPCLPPLVGATLTRPPDVANGLLHRRALGSIPPRTGKPRFRDHDARLRRVLRLWHRPSPICPDVVEARLPVLLSPGGHLRREPTPAANAAELSARITARAKRAWGRFKLAAISSFAFVEATGPIYIAAARWARAGPPPRTDRSRAAPGP